MAENQIVDSIFEESHRGLHPHVAHEAECPRKPAVNPIVARANHHVLGQGVLGAGLRQREIGEGQEILIEHHLVVEVLVARDAAERAAPQIGPHGEAVAEGRAAVGAGVVVGDPSRRGGILPRQGFVGGTSGESIGVTALPQIAESERVVDAQSVPHGPLHAEASAARPLPIAFVAREVVGVKPVAATVMGGDGHPHVGRDPEVGGGPHPPGVAAAVLHPDAGPFVSEGRKRVDVDDPAHRIAAVEGGLRPPQHLDPFDVGQVEIVGVLVHVGHVIDVEPHNGLVDAGPQPPHIKRRGHPRTVVGHVEIGHQRRRILERADALPLDPFAPDHRGGDRLVTQHKPLLDGRHLHAFDRHHRIDGLSDNTGRLFPPGDGRGEVRRRDRKCGRHRKKQRKQESS